MLVFKIQMIVIRLGLQDNFQRLSRQSHYRAAVMAVYKVAVVTQGDARAVHKLKVLSHPGQPLVLHTFLV